MRLEVKRRSRYRGNPSTLGFRSIEVVGQNASKWNFMMENREIGGIGFIAGRWPLDQDKPTLVFIPGAALNSKRQASLLIIGL